VNAIRARAKEHFPTVLLTLLSIVQALALELIWSHLHEVDYLFELTWIAVISWSQVSATLLGIVLIWVVYSGNVMRFRWVPTTSDSVLPFLIGLTEFLLIATLGADKIGQWLLLMALIFVLMNWVAHTTMRRARQDSDNAAYFNKLQPAQLRDFYPAFAITFGLTIAGIYLLLSGDRGILALLALLATNGVLGWQFYQAALFWNLSITEDA
jgi:hypothetical protein